MTKSDKRSFNQGNSETIYQRLRTEALTKYYKKPNFCKRCEGVIWVPDGKRVSDIKKKKFCSDDCRKSYSNKNKPPAYTPYPGKIEVVSLEGTEKPLIAPKAKEARVSALMRHKAKQEAKVREANKILPENLRTCAACGEGYDIKSRIGQPGRVTHCEDCTEEVEDRYVGNWTPAGASTGKNLHQWDIQPVKGGTQHVSKSSVA